MSKLLSALFLIVAFTWPRIRRTNWDFDRLKELARQKT